MKLLDDIKYREESGGGKMQETRNQWEGLFGTPVLSRYRIQLRRACLETFRFSMRRYRETAHSLLHYTTALSLSLSLSNLRVQTGLSFWTCPARHFSLSIAPRRLAGAWPLVNDDRLADMGWVQDPHSRIRSSYPIHFFKISIPDPVPDPPKFLDQLSFQIQIRICTHVCLLAGQMREEF